LISLISFASFSSFVSLLIYQFSLATTPKVFANKCSTWSSFNAWRSSSYSIAIEINPLKDFPSVPTSLIAAMA
jgi:hypothetical protein